MTEGWQPIEKHPLDDDECLLAVFVDDVLYVADRGGWVEGDIHEEWDEIEDGVRVKLWEDQDDGHWWSNHDVIHEPTHWMPLPSPPAHPTDTRSSTRDTASDM